MASFPASDFQGLFTTTLINYYRDRIKPKNFLQSLFTPKVKQTKTVSIQVQRLGEPIAVDVQRHDEGNINAWSKTTQKIFETPYFKEKFYITDLELYDRLWGASDGAAVPDKVFQAIIEDAAEKLDSLRDKIARAKEKMVADVFETGIVQLNAGLNVDYKRQAGSLIDPGPGNYLSDNVDIFAQLEADAKWMRQNGKVSTTTFEVYLGETAVQHFFKNTVVTNRQNLFNLKRDNLLAPKTNDMGVTFHGSITSGPYTFNIYSYTDYYEDANGVMQNYWNAKKSFMIPAVGYVFDMAYTAVPQLLKKGEAIKTGEFIISEFTDEEKQTHEMRVESAPLPIPVSVDQIVTRRMVAA
jgi:hypothetical protein